MTMLVEIDPCVEHISFKNRNSLAEKRGILQECGLIPGWILDAEASDSEETFEEIFAREYVFGAGFADDGKTKVDESGYMHYPGDPMMAPFLKVDRNGETFYQYPYAMVAIVNNETGATVTGRMD